MASPHRDQSQGGSRRGRQMTQAAKVSAELLQMNRDVLAALVTLGAKSGDPMQFITDATDRFFVASMLVQVR